MQTKAAIQTFDPILQKIAHRLELMGWISFGLQLILTLAAAGILAFTIGHRNLSEATTPGISVGVFWAICGTIVLFGGMYLAVRLARFAPLLRHRNPKYHPSKGEIAKILRMSVAMGLIGMLLMLLGEGTVLGVLVSKAIAQPKPGAIYDARELIRTVDLLAAVPHLLGIVAHYGAILISFSLLNWLPKLNRQTPTPSAA